MLTERCRVPTAWHGRCMSLMGFSSQQFGNLGTQGGLHTFQSDLLTSTTANREARNDTVSTPQAGSARAITLRAEESG